MHYKKAKYFHKIFAASPLKVLEKVSTAVQAKRVWFSFKTSAYMMSKAWWKTHWSQFKDFCWLLWASDEDLTLLALQEKYIPDAQKCGWQSWNVTVFIVSIISVTFSPSQWNWVTAELCLFCCQYSMHLCRDLLFENLCLVTDIGEICFWSGFRYISWCLSRFHAARSTFHMSTDTAL